MERTLRVQRCGARFRRGLRPAPPPGAKFRLRLARYGVQGSECAYGKALRRLVPNYGYAVRARRAGFGG
jgi:hypothetical protein